MRSIVSLRGGRRRKDNLPVAHETIVQTGQGMVRWYKNVGKMSCMPTFFDQNAITHKQIIGN